MDLDDLNVLVDYHYWARDRMLEAVAALTPDRRFDYQLMNGQPGQSILWHMLQHVVNHATYHRGQVTTMLRQLGAAPPKSQDLIVFYRERHPNQAS